MRRRYWGYVVAAVGALAFACGSSGSVAPDAGDVGSREAGLADTSSRRDAAKAKDSGHKSEDAAKHDGAKGGAPDAPNPLCGNGTLDPHEQCDDGNNLDLDGCDSTCRYEVVTRMTNLTIAPGPAPTGCTPTTNRFGSQFITDTARGPLNTTLQSDVTEGKVSTLLQFIGLSNLTGTSAVGFQLGLLNGAPDPARGAWPAAGNPEDWSFLATSTSVAGGLPTGLFTVTDLSGGTLTAGPTTVNLGILLESSPASFTLRDAHIFATIDATPPPSKPSPPPSLLAPGIEVFQTMTASGAGQGLCGNMTVASLAEIPVPSPLTTGAGACEACGGSSSTYTYCGPDNIVTASCNSLLDVLVGGCAIADCMFTGLTAFQPDVPAMTGGTIQTLSLDATTHKVTQAVAGDLDGYSAYFLFDANRAHFTGESCDASVECQNGQTCTGGVCK